MHSLVDFDRGVDRHLGEAKASPALVCREAVGSTTEKTLAMLSRCTLFALLLSVGVGNAAAQPHLVPHGSPLQVRSPYGVVLIEAFGPSGPAQEFLLHALLLPSFEREEAVGVRQTASGYEAFSVLPESRLWAAGFGRWEEGATGWDTDAARAVELRRETAPLDSSTATILHRVWERAILGTRYPHRPQLVRDGVIAHFTTEVPNRGAISGMAHSPPAGSPAAQLLDFSVLLGRYARGDLELAELRRQAERLLSVLIE